MNTDMSKKQDNTIHFKDEEQNTDNFKYNRLHFTKHIQYKNRIFVLDREVNDVIIISDYCGNSSYQPIVDDREYFFKNTLLKYNVEFESHEQRAQDYLTKKQNDLRVLLNLAKECFNKNNYTSAFDNYCKALELIDEDPYPDEFQLACYDLFAIKLCLALCKIRIHEYGTLLTAVDILLSLKDIYGSKFPIIYQYLSRVCYKLNQFSKAAHYAQEGLDVLSKQTITVQELKWPNSADKLITDDDIFNLKYNLFSILNQCKNIPKPDAICQAAFCKTEIREIYFNALNFDGYVHLQCTNKCNLKYHRLCWKSQCRSDKRKHGKDVLDTPCETDDCGGFYSRYLIYNNKLDVETIAKHSEIYKACKNQADGNKENESDKNQLKKHDKKIKIVKENSQKSVQNKQLNLNAKEYIPLQKSYQNSHQNIDNKIKSTFENNSNLDLEKSQLINSEVYVDFDSEYSKQNYQSTDIPKPNSKIFPENSGNNTLRYATENNNEICHQVFAPEFSSAFFVSDDSSPETSHLQKQTTLEKSSQTNTVTTMSVSTQYETEYYDKETQTNKNNNNLEIQIELLKSEVSTLKMELFQAEEDYNNVLTQHSILYVKHVNLTQINREEKATQTDSISCTNCATLNNNYKDKCDEIADLTMIMCEQDEENKIQKTKIENLKCNIYHLVINLDEVNAELNSVKNSNFNQQLQTLREENKQLKNKIVESTGYHKLLIEHITALKTVYLNYYKTFQRNGKTMIAELEYMKFILNADMIPSRTEIEISLAEWKKALEHAIQMENKIHEYCLDIMENLNRHDINNIELESFPLIDQPDNIFVRYFKYMFLRNLQDQLNSETMLPSVSNLYQNLDLSYTPNNNPPLAQYNLTHPAANTPQNRSFPNPQSLVNFAISANQNSPVGIAQNSQNQQTFELPIPNPILNMENPLRLPFTPAKVETKINLNTNMPKPEIENFRNDTESVVEEMENLNSNDEYQKQTKKEIFLENPVSRVACGPMPSSYTGAIQKNGGRISPSDLLKKSEPKLRKDYTVKGVDSLTNILAPRFPQYDKEKVSECLKILRSRRGKLIGVDLKQICIDLKKIFKEISIPNMASTSQSSVSSASTPVSSASTPVKNAPSSVRSAPSSVRSVPSSSSTPWTQINPRKSWTNKSPNGPCSICMEPFDNDRVQLRCHHFFHKKCIKDWFHYERICPLCRQFATLDDEYPPL